MGETSRLPAYVRAPLRAMMEVSRKNQGMTLCLALSYGGRETLAYAARKLSEVSPE